MNPNDANEPTSAGTGDDAHAVPRHTTPAWESELLLSIGLVVGLLQLPPLLDTRFDAAVARAPDYWLLLITYSYLYAKVAIYGLVATFVVHLLTRGFWVALLGLRSVFPGGVRWDRLERMGPVARELARRESVPLPGLIEQADNFASSVFAFGFMMVATSVSVGLMTTVLAAVATLISQFLLGGREQMNVLLVLISLAVVPFALAGFVDRRFGARLKPGGRAWRAVAFAQSTWRHVFGTRLYREMMLVFGTNIGQRRASLLTSVTFLALSAVVAVEVAARHDAMDPFASEVVPGEGAAVLERAHYADRRGDDLYYSTRPFVQSEVVTGPYLRLFVPLMSRRSTSAIRAACPEASLSPDADVARESARRGALLACFGRLLEPRLDGAAIAAAFEFGDDPASASPGLIAHVPLAEVAAGRHELTLNRLRGRDDEGRPGEPSRIAFWR